MRDAHERKDRFDVINRVPKSDAKIRIAITGNKYLLTALSGNLLGEILQLSKVLKFASIKCKLTITK